MYIKQIQHPLGVTSVIKIKIIRPIRDGICELDAHHRLDWVELSALCSSASPRLSQFERFGQGCAGRADSSWFSWAYLVDLGWAGLGWIELSDIGWWGLSWAGLHWAGLIRMICLRWV
jgi:hypothetical protein